MSDCQLGVPILLRVQKKWQGTGAHKKGRLDVALTLPLGRVHLKGGDGRLEVARQGEAVGPDGPELGELVVAAEDLLDVWNTVAEWGVVSEVDWGPWKEEEREGRAAYILSRARPVASP